MSQLSRSSESHRLITWSLLVVVFLNLCLSVVRYRSGDAVSLGEWVLGPVVAFMTMLELYGRTYLNRLTLRVLVLASAIIILAVFIYEIIVRAKS